MVIGRKTHELVVAALERERDAVQRSLEASREELRDARKEVHRLVDIIVQMKRAGHEVPPEALDDTPWPLHYNVEDGDDAEIRRMEELQLERDES